MRGPFAGSSVTVVHMENIVFLKRFFLYKIDLKFSVKIFVISILVEVSVLELVVFVYVYAPAFHFPLQALCNTDCYLMIFNFLQDIISFEDTTF